MFLLSSYPSPILLSLSFSADAAAFFVSGRVYLSTIPVNTPDISEDITITGIYPNAEALPVITASIHTCPAPCITAEAVLSIT